MKGWGLMRVREVLNLKWLSIVGLCACMASISAFAQDDPHQLVEETTAQVLALLKTGIDPVKEPDEFVLQLSAVLDPVIAFNYIAKGVLGVHAEKASLEQQKQFALSFKKGLVSTYGKGLSGFQDLEIRVLAPTKPVGDARRATVVQEVRTTSGVTKVSYSMAKNRQDEWKVINFVLNGINFGHSFRGQFAAAVEKNNGDIDRTISQWEKGVQ
jgi:phospholipid transport system substrate-binding protein